MSFKLERVATFNQRLNMAMSDKAMRAIDLSRKTGFSETAISQYRKNVMPDIDKVAILSNALQVNPVYLLGFNVEPYYEPDVYGLSSEDRALLYAYDNANDLEKDVVSNVLKFKRQDTSLRSSKAASNE